MERLAAWLLTDPGKKAVLLAACIGTSGSVLLKCLPNTFLIKQYMDFVHFYEHGMKKPLSEELKNRFTKAMDLIEVPEEERQRYTPFQVIGWDVHSAGSSGSRFGAIIGIPINYTYKTVNDVDTANIRINYESVLWGTQEADLFLESLILSEKAQLYGIAREIKMTQSSKLLFECTFATLPVFMYYGVTNYFNRKFNLYVRPLGLRLVLYTLASVFAAGHYFVLKDTSQQYFEKKIDEELKEKNVIFAEGGREMYGKLMARNIALRELLGNAGKKTYTALGNEKSLIRQKHVPLSERRLFFEEALKEMKA